MRFGNAGMTTGASVAERKLSESMSSQGHHASGRESVTKGTDEDGVHFTGKP